MKGGKASPPYVNWPTRDRLAWERAVTEWRDDFLADRPRLAEWAPSTQRNARNVISAFLRWLEARGQITAEGSLADLVTPKLLLAYVRERWSLYPPTTVHREVLLIEGALGVFAPDRDWRWVKRICRKLGAPARRYVAAPRPIVHAAVLYDLGLQVMRESLSNEGNTTDASLYRSGLAIALLAAAPMRIANFAALAIGRQLRREGDHWMVYLSAAETKTRRADVWPVSDQLGQYLEQYLAVVRPALRLRSRHSTETPRLWIGDSGHPIGDQVLRRIIATLTRERLGLTINPHSFRHCAATTFVLERPRDALQTSALLGHASPRTTERHYIVQQRQLVQQDYIQLLQKRVRAAGRSDQLLALDDCA